MTCDPDCELDDYSQELDVRIGTQRSHPCPSCGLDLRGATVRLVKERSPDWHFVHCPRCHYDVAIWKLAVTISQLETFRGPLA